MEDNDFRNIDTSVSIALGFAILGGSTALTISSFGLSSPVTLATSALGAGLVGGAIGSVVPIFFMKYAENEQKPIPSPSKAIQQLFLGSNGKNK